VGRAQPSAVLSAFADEVSQNRSFPVTNILTFNGTGISWTAIAVPLNVEQSLIRLDDERTIFLCEMLIQTAMISRLFPCAHTVSAGYRTQKQGYGLCEGAIMML
jgi:hypothetical protein